MEDIISTNSGSAIHQSLATRSGCIAVDLLRVVLHLRIFETCDMQLPPQQQEALDAVRSWLDDPAREQIFKIWGFAGTGKTTIAKAFAEIVEGTVLFAAYTGKAAYVLRDKGCIGAQTIHSLIYLPAAKSAQRLRNLQAEYVKKKADEAHEDILVRLQRAILNEQENVKRPSFTLNLESELCGADLLIVDEVSMVNEQMALDLLHFDTPILVLGDPAQLPPVKGGGYFTNQDPDILLTEIHRQAAGSPVLSLATDVREGRGLSGDLVIPKGQLVIADMAEFDQVLVGTNRSRKIVNQQMRHYYNFPAGLPVPGDRLICTRNDRDTGLFNGSQWMVESCSINHDDERLSMLISSCDDLGNSIFVQAHPHPFRDEEIPFFEIREAQCFEYAYAMTVHKAQGSQWDSVALVDESGKFPSHSRQSWLYTGITRAAKKLKVIK